MQQFVSSETTTITVERFQGPQQFESEFKRIIGIADAEKLLLIIDNLGWVSGEKAVVNQACKYHYCQTLPEGQGP